MELLDDRVALTRTGAGLRWVKTCKQWIEAQVFLVICILVSNVVTYDVYTLGVQVRIILHSIHPAHMEVPLLHSGYILLRGQFSSFSSPVEVRCCSL